jgi:phage terminase large subunit GpA-like protein
MNLESFCADINAVELKARQKLKPPPRLKLSEWADQHYRLGVENSAEAGQWRCIQFQRGIMDAISAPDVEQVWFKKAARLGWTLICGSAVAYHIHHDPTTIMIVQPSIDDAKEYSKENIAPMLAEIPVLADLMKTAWEEEQVEEGPKSSSNTIRHKKFPGGVLSLVGANSGAGFRRISRRLGIGDELDAWPPSAGQDGDQIKLMIKRGEFYWNRKALGGSTPLLDETSRIERLYKSGNQQKYFVPCPHCGHMDFLVFRKPADGASGHWMKFDPKYTADAHFVCSGCDEAIEHKHKTWMIDHGEWRPTAPEAFTASGRKIVSFHLWAAYSPSPNATWAHIAQEFVEAKDNVEELKTFVNTTLGETWKDHAEALEWERLWERRENYEGVPEQVKFLTCGVDVQKKCFVYEVVGWAMDKQSWSIETGEIDADTDDEREWSKLDELLNRNFDGHTIRMLAVDSGYKANHAYNWTRGHPRSRVMAVKGKDGDRDLLGIPKKRDVKVNGKRVPRGAEMSIVGVDDAKSELFSFLRLKVPADGVSYPPGFCHFPKSEGYDQEFFRQLTAEQLQTKKNDRGHPVRVWQLVYKENHRLDCRVYARAAAFRLGLDRYRGKKHQPPATPPPAASTEQQQPGSPSPAPVASQAEAPPPPRNPKKPRTRPDSRFRVKGSWSGRH